MNFEKGDATEPSEALEQVLVFMLEGEALCVPISIVQDIVCLLESLPPTTGTPLLASRTVHVRGQALPVEDLRTLLGKAPIQCSARQRVLVLRVAGTLKGFLVDSVVDIQGVLPSSRVPLPHFPFISSLLPANEDTCEERLIGSI